ncbi:50S ribosomal protein L6 [Candidatus Phytoplasma melaleucae]|uniref:50S ribosomal protein L6 n=1 Tax=Candidatus Phytoplasma melaleucae TaxID=2982630 RepID=A0ABT9DEN3_9MOLU|nr:50S ribosomal protein L6 ['Melaleuca sp.' phytoplasma]MDO8168112.1 50S ribosomal protein L6 ['Melaleuca sp.' phytoplasma]MDV3205260.1 50S ribosomal protein L6 [Weeping tea tree witches'-broom phytoplasma]
MSRVGKKVILVPENIQVEIKDKNLVSVKSPKGELIYQFNPLLNILLKNNSITITRPNDKVFMKKIHGTTRSLLNNMITGLKECFVKKLEIVGLGYNCRIDGSQLIFKLGFSHEIVVDILPELEVEVSNKTFITIKGTEKQLVGEFAQKLVSLYKPEPYKGRGIRCVGEYIYRKAGKSSKK